jgi:asparagine synthase (glutamine-hydrolysing)
MCGIWLYLLNKSSNDNVINYYKSFTNLRPRGPDRSHIIELHNYGIICGFHRLSIMDVSPKADQPFIIETENRLIYAMCNGEVYNFHELCSEYELKPKTGSDCEVIPLIYEKYGIDKLVNVLIGEYAFIVIDINKETEEVNVLVANDRFGVRPLFYSKDAHGLNFSSELKGLYSLDASKQGVYNPKYYEYVKRFKPRTYMKIREENKKWVYEEVEYYSIKKIPTVIYDLEEAKIKIRESLTKAVISRLESNRPLGCMLSGGLDSSLVAGIASQELKKHGLKLRTFSVGMPESTDEKYARMVAEHIGSEHTHIELDQSVFLDTIPQIVWITETFDITTVRASTGQYLGPKKISETTDIKVLLIGDGSDEVASGYMYFHKAPTCEEMHKENIRLVEDIHLYDGLRADRGIASNGIEARVPFLDHRFIETYLSIDAKLRMPTNGMEKWLLRDSFKDTGLLPNEVLYRKKEAFSDGISSKKKSWYEIIQEYVNELYSEEEYNNKKKEYDYLEPVSKESLYYRELFSHYYGYGNVCKVIPYYWLPKWVGATVEPSARTLKIYNEVKHE